MGTSLVTHTKKSSIAKRSNHHRLDKEEEEEEKEAHTQVGLNYVQPLETTTTRLLIDSMKEGKKWWDEGNKKKCSFSFILGEDCCQDQQFNTYASSIKKSSLLLFLPSSHF